MTSKIWTKSEIKAKLMGIYAKVQGGDPLSDNDREWLARSLMAVYDYQTSTEKMARVTTEHNKVGFSGVDAEILSSFAEQWKFKGYLSTKQFGILAKKMPKYAGQLEKIAAERAGSKQPELGVIANASECPVVNGGFIKFPNGAEICTADLAEEIHDGEVVSWTAYVDSVKYVLVND